MLVAQATRVLSSFITCVHVDASLLSLRIPSSCEAQRMPPRPPLRSAISMTGWSVSTTRHERISRVLVRTRPSVIERHATSRSMACAAPARGGKR